MDEDVGMPVPDGLEGDAAPTAGTDGIKLPEVSNLSAERCGVYRTHPEITQV